MSYLKDFVRHINNRDYSAFSSLWEEYCAGDEIDHDELFAILKEAKSSSFADLFGKDVSYILPLWEKISDPSASKKLFSLIVDIDNTRNPQMGEKVSQYIQDHYAGDEFFQEKIRLIGFRDPLNYQGAIRKYELLSHINKGKFVFHLAGWGVGMVTEHSLVREQLRLEFDYVAGEKDIPFETAFNTLVPLPDDHFLSQRFGDPDKLEALAKKDPLLVIHTLLRDLGPKTAAEIKDELCELVIPEDEWTKWWQNTRAKIKKDTLIEVPSSLRDPFFLRSQEVSHEERLQKNLATKPDASTLIQMLYSFIKDFAETLKNETFRKELCEKVEEVLSYPEVTIAQKLQLLFFLEDLKESSSKEEVLAIVRSLSSGQQILALLEEIQILSFKKKILVLIRENFPNWESLFLEIFLQLDQTTLRDFVLGELLTVEKAVALVKDKISTLCAHPASYPAVFIWYFQKAVAQKKLPFADVEGLAELFEAFLVLLSHIENNTEHRDLVKKMHSILTDGRFAIVRKIMKDASLATVQEFVLLSTKCHSLSEHDIKILSSLAEVAHPSLAKKRAKKGKVLEEDVLWTTEEGLKKVKERIEQIATVETVENAKEIETARAHGDLRENAEFKAALERRDRLQSELKLLSGQVQNARVLTATDISTKHVDIGSIVTCQKSNGETLTYTLLGPWDADPDKNILAYQSKLAQAMKGKEPGETFDFQKDTFTITGISSYL